MSNIDLKKLADRLLSDPLLSMFAPNPDNHPSILYKYRNWKDQYHKNLLIKNEIYMSPPSGLNDPFDCRIFENHLKYVNTSDEKEKYISDSVRNNLQYLNSMNLSVDDATELLRNRLEDTLNYQVRSEVIQSEIDDKYVGIACVSEKWNSILMWSHYADNHKGYCIGLDEKSLRFGQLFGKLSRVKYSDNYPEINPLNKTKKSYELKYFYKCLDWEYEKEIRMMNLYVDNNKTNRIITLENKYIKEVIIGLQTPKKDRIEITSIARDKNIDVWQCIKAEFAFKVERFKI